MLHELLTFHDERRCAYLADRDARVYYRVLLGVSPEAWQRMLERGWRRFGHYVFRPQCDGCGECVSLRIPVEQFRPTKSQRRVLRRTAGLVRTLARPTADPQRLAVLAAWHAEKEQTRGWSPLGLPLENYEDDFCGPHPCAYELTLWAGESLVAVDLVDLTPQAISSIYCYYDPRFAALSPGTATVLAEIALARELGLAHVYLGYRVAGCPSSAYKATFRPHELLIGRPEEGQAPRWVAEDRHAAAARSGREHPL
jgi:arginine-tRNA-protein transferase